MTINSKAEITKLKKTILGREAKLYHACQLQDFRSYLALGGVPSRNKLSNSGYAFTEFDTDAIDQEHQLWDKVFGNFSDFGLSYPRSDTKSFPNPYGPIQIVINPGFLDNISDIAISLRSAGAADFKRDAECLKSDEEFDKIYLNPKDSALNTKYVAFSKDLNSRFNRNNSSSPEFNCTIKEEIIPVEYWAYIIVDGYQYKNEPLIAEVSKTCPKKAVTRNYQKPRDSILLELSKLLISEDFTKAKLLIHPTVSDDLKSWANNIDGFHFDRFIRYLSKGTIRA